MEKIKELNRILEVYFKCHTDLASRNEENEWKNKNNLKNILHGNEIHVKC